MNKLSLIVLFSLSLQNLFAQHNYNTIDFQYPKVGQMNIIPVFFDLDKFWIRPDARKILDSITLKLLAIDSFVFAIESYSDCRSSKEYNMDLSKRRSDSIVAYIHKVSNNRLQIVSMGIGEDSLLNDCNCEGRSRQLSTRYYEDTVDGIVHLPEIQVFDSLLGTWRIASYHEVEPLIKSGQYFMPCNESEHQRNRRTVLRIIGFRKN